MKVRVTKLSSVSELKHEGLREEAEGWAPNSLVEAGSAVLVPDDGSGPLEGFYIPAVGKGMVGFATSDEGWSDWIEADNLEAMFKKFAASMF